VLEGIVPGGGVAPLRALAALDELKVRGDEKYGVECIRKALEAPIRQIAENCGLDGGEVMAEVKSRKGNEGFDAFSGKYTDLVKAGVVDPVQVTITALRNAGSVASLNLTTGVLVTELKKEKRPVGGAIV
jgi:chaperonin GroEL